MSEFKHISVLLDECMNGLAPKNGGIYFDGTLGGGGHTSKILELSSPNGKVIATDLDDYAIDKAKERLKPYNGRFTLVKDNFKNFLAIKEKFGIDGFDGILLDLGVSSFQLDDKSRGFSYMASEQALDMRMDNTCGITAEQIVNTYSEKQLSDIFTDYGEERFSRSIAKNIVEYRKNVKISTIGQLNDIIQKSIPAKFKQDGHPSKRTFQALRIEVNGELEGLYQTIKDMALSLKKGGRIVIISFHSLEDRAVKKAFKDLETDCICDKRLPICTCGHKKQVEILTKHPITATERELLANSRAKSAKLRIAERV